MLCAPSDLSDVRAVFFDAVGTLIHPEPPAAEVYLAAARRFGSRHDLPAIARRFVAAFRRQEQIDLAAGLRTDEDRERTRWQAIVAEVLDDVNDPESCFRELYEYFARPAAWRCTLGTAEVLAALAARGYVVGLASNFDHRLRRVAEGLPELRLVRHVVVSSEVGWRKPAAAFFHAACATAALSPVQVLFVGDDPVNDLAGAQGAGSPGLLVGPGGVALADLFSCFRDCLSYSSR